MENQIGRLLVHIHNPKITAVVTGECNNGSLKVMLTDLSAPSAKLRKPKQSTIEKAYKSDWK